MATAKAMGKAKRARAELPLSHDRISEIQSDVALGALSSACSANVTHTSVGRRVDMFFFVPRTTLVTLANLISVAACFDESDCLEGLDVGWSDSKSMISIRCRIRPNHGSKRVRRAAGGALSPSAFARDLTPLVAERLRRAEAQLVLCLRRAGAMQGDESSAADVVSHARVGTHYLTSALCASHDRVGLETLRELTTEGGIFADAWVAWDDAAAALVVTVKLTPDG